MDKQTSDKWVKLLLAICAVMVVGIVLYNAINTPPASGPTVQYLTESYSLEKESSDKAITESVEPPDTGTAKAPASSSPKEAANSSSRAQKAAASSRVTSSRSGSSGKTSSAYSSQEASSGEESSGPIQKSNINTATYEQLMAVDGIGEVIARNIIEFRDNCGGFDNMDQLMNVSGIGYARRNLLMEYFYAAPAEG